MDPYVLFKVFNEPAEFRCALTQQVMRDPVNCSDGYVYDRAAIEAHLKKSSLSPVNKNPLPSRQLTPNDQRKQAITQYRQEVCETCTSLAGYYKDTSPQDAFNFMVRIKKVLGEDFYTNQDAVNTTIDIGELVIRYADSITPDQQRQAGIDQSYLDRMKAAVIEPLLDIYRAKKDNQNLGRIRGEAGKVFIPLKEFGIMERILMTDIQLNTKDLWTMLTKVQITLNKKKEAARTILLFADWCQQNGLPQMVQSQREEAYKFDPSLRNVPANTVSLPNSADMAVGDAKTNAELREQLKASLFRDLKATPADEGLTQNLTEFLDFEGDTVGSLTIGLANFIAHYGNPQKANEAANFADYLTTMVQSHLDFNHTVVEALVEENKGLKGSVAGSELVTRWTNQKDASAKNQQQVQEVGTAVRGTAGAPPPKAFKPPAPVGSFKNQLNGVEPEPEPARPMVNLGAPSPMGLPGVRPQSTALPPPGRLGGSLPARNPLGLPPPSATGAGAGAGSSSGVMTFSVESGTQEEPQQPPEPAGRVPFSVGGPGGLPRPGMGGGAPSPLNPMGSPRPMSMNYGRSPLGESAPAPAPQPAPEEPQNNRPPSGGGLASAPSGGLKKMPFPGMGQPPVMGMPRPGFGIPGRPMNPPPEEEAPQQQPEEPQNPPPSMMAGMRPMPGFGPRPGMGMPGPSSTPPPAETNNNQPPNFSGFRPPGPGNPLPGGPNPGFNPAGGPGGNSNPPNGGMGMGPRPGFPMPGPLGGAPGGNPNPTPASPGPAGMPGMGMGMPRPGGLSDSGNNALGRPPLGSSPSSNALNAGGAPPPSIGGMPPRLPTNPSMPNFGNPPGRTDSNPPAPDPSMGGNNNFTMPPKFPGLRPPMMPLGGGGSDNSDVVVGLPAGALGTNPTPGPMPGMGGPLGPRPGGLPTMPPGPLTGGPPRPLTGSGNFPTMPGGPGGNPPSTGQFGTPPPMGGGIPPRPGFGAPGTPPQPLGGGMPPRPGMPGPGGFGTPPPNPGGFGGNNYDSGANNNGSNFNQPPNGGFGGAPPNPGNFGGLGPRPGMPGPGGPGNFGAPPNPGNFGGAPNPGGYGAPPNPGNYGGAPNPGGYGAPPNPGGYGAPPNPGGYGAPPNAGGYGGAPNPGFPPMRPLGGMPPKFPMTPPGQ
eukprot:TRINITY_DN288_c1_g3_i2.p1 TRINITY_DN288_c1_g3~~TRINITY_DN288_c1_g3_i2.p1  ORF type:complete len:1148 (+),score=279.60 TRINITY_DN288_c1_g3_i2:1787-5230(+)